MKTCNDLLFCEPWPHKDSSRARGSLAPAREQISLVRLRILREASPSKGLREAVGWGAATVVFVRSDRATQPWACEPILSDGLVGILVPFSEVVGFE